MVSAVISEDSRYFRRNFSLVISEMAISGIASSIFLVLVLWISISVTKSPLITGLTGSLLSIPLLLGFVTGGIIDKTDRKRTFAVIAQLSRSLSAAILLLAVFSHSFDLDVTALLVSATMYGLSTVFLVPVRAIWYQTFIRKSRYLKGVSYTNLTATISRLAGYTLSGIIMPFSLELSATAVAITFSLSALTMLFISEIETPKRPTGKIMSIIFDGFRYIVNLKVVLSIILLSSIAGLFWNMLDTVSTVFVNEILKLSSLYLSYTFFMVASGGAIGSILISRVHQMREVGKKMSWIVGISGTALIFLGIYPTIFVLLGVYFLTGLLSTIFSAITTTVFLVNVPKERMGRVQGAFDTFQKSFSSGSGIIAGFLMTIIFPTKVFLVTSIGLLILSGVTFILPYVKRLAI